MLYIIFFLMLFALNTHKKIIIIKTKIKQTIATEATTVKSRIKEEHTPQKLISCFKFKNLYLLLFFDELLK